MAEVPPRVLLLHPDAGAALEIVRALQRQGCYVAVAVDVQDALDLARPLRPDLVVCSREVRGATAACCHLWDSGLGPVLLLDDDRPDGSGSARGDLPRVVAAGLGLTSPRPAPPRPEDLEVDPDTRVVRAGGRAATLTALEHRLLRCFLDHPGMTLSRSQLLREVWGYDVGTTSTVTVHVRRLRQKIEDDPRHPTRIQTVWGEGYRYGARIG
ncbi:MAG: response regulator transcription factor [Acidimicrobiia bacterium]|nr:response regulator transcription factor [Acidimicrobiia bacterium]